MLKKLENISSKTVLRNNWWEYRADEYIIPSGKKAEYHYVHTAGSTFVIPQLENGNFVMTKQFRYLNRRYSLEFPGGGLKHDVHPLSNAIAELREEAGFEASGWKYLGLYNPYNGVTDELCYVFLASGLTKCKAEPEESEEFEIFEITQKEIINKINKGEIWDGMTLAAWSMYYFSDSIEKSCS